MFLMDTFVLPLGNEVSYNGNRIIISQMNEVDFSCLFLIHALQTEVNLREIWKVVFSSHLFRYKEPRPTLIALRFFLIIKN